MRAFSWVPLPLTLVLSGCAPSIELVAPLANVEPECAPRPASQRLLSGHLDLGAPPDDGYQLALAVEVTPPTLFVDEVDVFFLHESRDGEVLTEPRLADNGEFPRTARVEAGVQDGVLVLPLVTKDEVAALADDPTVGPRLVGPTDEVDVFAHVRARAAYASSFVESDWLRFRVHLCAGCLVDPACVDAPTAAGACRIGQDVAVSCSATR